ncbi:hypothetical protein CCACVL1_22533 [Corchorus capsularis]|uniref:Uncharacterized protein n=1 Tax=Corchorus capsularis TaxID=210143 RepID=A0A1R3GY30_COCAP|nr:hypothetical protein CCACVL1_22533 [Corchorus capsularis]
MAKASDLQQLSNIFPESSIPPF